MDACKRWLVVSVCLAAVLPSGCAAQSTGPKDPFATTPQQAAQSQSAAAPAAGGAAAPGTSINQVAYDEPITPAPGTSIKNEQAEADKPTVWRKLTKPFTQEGIDESYRAVTGRSVSEAAARELYNEGDKLFREQKYEEAAKKFAAAADRWPNSLLEEDALYMQGESYFFVDRYGKSRDAFELLLKRYQNSRHLDRVVNRQFLIGRYWDEKGRDHAMLNPNFFDKSRPWFDTHGNGLKVYENIRLADPTGPLADDAVMAQGAAYFRDDRHEDAAFQFEILRKDYPNSEHQKQAHLLGLQSYMNSYQGPQYDRTPLDKADKLVSSTLRNLGHQMPEEQPRLREAQSTIRNQAAERDYDLAEYYRRLGYNRAARQHYAVIMRDYADTKFADLSRQRMTETESLPPEPPDHFPWLTAWLGDKKNK